MTYSKKGRERSVILRKQNKTPRFSVDTANCKEPPWENIGGQEVKDRVHSPKEHSLE